MKSCFAGLTAFADAGGQADKQVGIVRLDFCLVGGFVAGDASAPVAFVDYDISLFRVGKGLDRAENTAAVVCSVAGVDINVQ